MASNEFVINAGPESNERVPDAAVVLLFTAFHRSLVLVLVIAAVSVALVLHLTGTKFTNCFFRSQRLSCPAVFSKSQ
jgi:hypothetical protein